MCGRMASYVGKYFLTVKDLTGNGTTLRFVTLHLSTSNSLHIAYDKYQAITRRCFDVVTTSLESKQRCNNVETTSCAYWIERFLVSGFLKAV